MERNNKPRPLFTWGKNRPRALLGQRGMWEYHPQKTADIDVGIIELTPEEAEDLEEAYVFTPAERTSEPRAKTPGVHYVITGYAATRNRVTLDNLPAVATHIVTGDIGGVADLKRYDKAEAYHFSLKVPTKRVPKLAGGLFEIPKAAGMSGGGIWLVNVDTDRLLTTTPLLVGIGIEFYKTRRKYVATRVGAALPLIDDVLTGHAGPAP